MKFFNPTAELKELLLLQHIESNPDTTQKEIASVIDGAPSMVNVYIDNLEEKGYMVRDYQSAKVVYYKITAEGVTTHFVDEGTDTGPIILQKVIGVKDDDTVETLKAKVLTVEHEILPETIRLFCEGKLFIKGRKVIINEE